MNEDPIEPLLRKAPQPAPPPDLRDTLEKDIPPGPPGLPAPAAPAARPPFWRRWLPTLAYGCVLLGCLAVLGVQTVQLLELRRERARLREIQARIETMRERQEALQKETARARSLDQLKKDEAEAQRLRQEIARLSELAQALPNLRAEEQRLQAAASNRLAQAAAAGALEPDPFAEEKEKAMRIACINHLKHIGLAARLYADDHNQVFPATFLAASNTLGSHKILFCPARPSGTEPPAQWQDLRESEVTYELLAPGAANPDPQAVLARCPIHNSVVLVDGSVQVLPPGARLVESNGLKRIVWPTQPERTP